MKNIFGYLKHLFIDDSKKINTKELSTALSLLWYCYIFSMMNYGVNVFSSTLKLQHCTIENIRAIQTLGQIVGLLQWGMYLPWTTFMLAGSMGLVYRGFGQSVSLWLKLLLGVILYMAIRSIFVLPFLFTDYPGMMLGIGNNDSIEMIRILLGPLKWILSIFIVLGVSIVIALYFQSDKDLKRKAPIKGLDRQTYTLNIIILTWISLFLSIAFLLYTLIVLEGKFILPSLIITECFILLVLNILSIIMMINRIRNSIAGYSYLAILVLISILVAAGYGLIILASHLLLKELGLIIINISFTILCLFHLGLMLLPSEEVENNE